MKSIWSVLSINQILTILKKLFLIYVTIWFLYTLAVFFISSCSFQNCEISFITNCFSNFWSKCSVAQKNPFLFLIWNFKSILLEQTVMPHFFITHIGISISLSLKCLSFVDTFYWKNWKLKIKNNNIYCIQWYIFSLQRKPYNV